MITTQPKYYQRIRISKNITYIVLIISQILYFTVAQVFLEKSDIKNQILSEQSHQFSPGTQEFWKALLISITCVLGAGFCSGLTVGYLSIDNLTLRIQQKNGTDLEKKQANKILPIIEEHHLLLSTLLISNAVFMECLPIYLHEIVPALAAILISTFFVVIVGEIIPQAYCTGPSQLYITEKCVPAIQVLECSLYPIVFPMAKFLDWFLGEHSNMIFPKKDLVTLIEIHHKVGSDKGDGFNKEEVILLKSLLEMREQNVEIDKVYMLNTKEIFNRDLIRKVKMEGFSEVPICVDNNRQQILGVLRTKSLLMAEEKHMNKKIGKRFPLSKALVVSQDTSILEMLMIFQEKKQTLAFITDQLKKNQAIDTSEKMFFSRKNLITEIDEEYYYKKKNNHERPKFQIIGIICLKDVFEEILDQELKDDDFHINFNNYNNNNNDEIKQKKKLMKNKSFKNQMTTVDGQSLTSKLLQKEQ